jgi:hypothetical protein
MQVAPDCLRRLSTVTALAIAIALGLAGCGEVAKTGRSPAFLIIDVIEGASGAEPDEFGTVLFSDVQTLVEQQIGGQTVRVPTVFADPGRVSFRLGLKDPGTPTNPTSPSTINAITVTRYRVTFKRADGRNTPGVDVPHGFDGGFTVTVPGGGTASAAFELVRHQMKQEPPIRNLVNNGGAGLVSTIAEVTFWGRDQAGNEVSVTGNITVNFGDFGDPS